MAAYQPLMMVRVLLYGYRRDTHPDHDTIATFRNRHLDASAGLFVQVLQLCRKAGLVTLGHVATSRTR